MTLKVDMLFTQSTNKAGGSADPVRVAGWSEGWYTNLDITAARAAVDRLCGARTTLLTESASIVGQRYRIVGGGSSTDNKIFPGQSVLLADLPAMALLCTCGGQGVPNVRRFALRGLADIRSVEGEYVPSTGYIAGLDLFGRLLAQDGWRFKGRVLTNPKAAILSISTLGAVITKDAIALTPGQKVRLLNVRDANGVLQSGQYGVGVVTSTTSFNIIGYSGAAADNGFIRLDAFDYFPVAAGSFARGRVITRKVGRAFFQFRGRRSTTR